MPNQEKDLNAALRNIRNNPERLAELWVRTELTQYRFFASLLPPDPDFRRGKMDGAYLVAADPRQFSTFDHAFAAVFKKFLYLCEEWQDDKWPDTSVEEWRNHLRNYWLPTYFPAAEFAAIPPRPFIERLNTELRRFGLADPFIRKFSDQCRNLRTIVVNKDDWSTEIFGSADQICFIYSSWSGG